MTAGRYFVSWEGAGESYFRSKRVVGAAQTSRFMPFRDDDMARQVMVKSGQNQSGSSWESYHAGVKTAHKSDNYGKM